MVSVLPAKVSPWQSIGQAMTNLGKSAPELMEKRYEKNQIQQGLSGLSESNPELKPLLDFMNSVAGTKQGAQYTEALAPEITKLMQSKQQASPQTGNAIDEINKMLQERSQPIQMPGFNEPAQQPQFAPPSNQLGTPEPSFDSVYDKVQKKFGEQYFPFANKSVSTPSDETKRPQKPPKPPKPIGPQEENRMRAELQKNGVTRKEVQDDFINKFKQNQKDEYDAAKEGYTNLKDYQDARTKEDDRFFTAIKENLKEMFPGMGPEEENIWKGIARTNEDVGSDEARFRDASQRYNQLVEQPLAAFTDTGPALPYFSLRKPEAVRDSVEDSRSMIQDHLNTINQMPTNEQFPKELKGEITNYLRKKYRTEMFSKDFGVAQAAYAVSNLSDKTQRSLNSIPKYPEPSIHRPKVGLPAVSDKVREELTNKLSEKLRNLDPEDSLILARDFAKENRYPEEVFNRALTMAIKNGLMLSDFQRQERPELSIPQKMDLNSVLRGKRNVFDLFKRKK